MNGTVIPFPHREHNNNGPSHTGDVSQYGWIITYKYFSCTCGQSMGRQELSRRKDK
jgi:hypothetical protein